LPHLGRKLGHEGAHLFGELGVALEVVVVVVALVLFHHRVPFGTNGADVKPVKGGEIGGVKARAQHGVVDRLAVGVFGAFDRADQAFKVVVVNRGVGQAHGGS